MVLATLTKYMHTIVVEPLLFSEPLFDDAELGVPPDDPPALLLSFPLDSDLCHKLVE